jgi:hypothetical protein
LLAEGPTKSVDRLLRRVEEVFADNIDRQSVEDVTLNDPPDGFEIRR